MQGIERDTNESVRKMHSLDDIERLREPMSLYREMEKYVSHLKQNISKLPEKLKDAGVIESLHLLDELLQEVRKTIPLIPIFDYENVPANGFRSAFRFCIKLIEALNSTKNPMKLQSLTVSLARHLSMWSEMLRMFRRALPEGKFELSNSCNILRFGLKGFDSSAHQVLIHKRFMTQSYDKTMYFALMILVRASLWYIEPSLMKKLFSNHYFSFRGTSASHVTKLSIRKPEHFANCIRASDSMLVRSFSSTRTVLVYSFDRISTKYTQKKFKIYRAARYLIQLSAEKMFFTLNEPAVGVEVSASRMKFFLVRSDKRRDDSSQGKEGNNCKNGQSRVRHDENTVQVEEECASINDTGLIKSAQGKCAFYSYRRLENAGPRSQRENEGKILLYLHGGAFFGPKPRLFIDTYLRDWSRKMPGVTLLVPQYAYAPENTFPVAWQEILDLYIWLVTTVEAENKLKMKIDPSKIALCGDSAGGLLCASLLVMLNEINKQFKQNIPIPLQVILVYPKSTMRLEMSPSLILSYYDYLVNSFVLIRCGQSLIPITKKDSVTGEKRLITQDERNNLPNEWYNDDKYQVVDSPVLSPVSYDAWADLTYVNLNVIVMTFDPVLDDGVNLAKKWKGKVNLHVADNVCHGALPARNFAACADSLNERVLEVVRSAINSL